KSVPVNERPPVIAPFFAFRTMVGIGLIMIATGICGIVLWWRGTLLDHRWFLFLTSKAWWLGFAAVIARLIVTETGRQPWVAYGILRTADATSPVTTQSVATTLALFIVVYGIIFSMGIYYINRLIVRGPEGRAIKPPDIGTPNRPIWAAHDASREAFAR